jgi:hypothetical protein
LIVESSSQQRCARRATPIERRELIACERCTACARDA